MLDFERFLEHLNGLLEFDTERMGQFIRGTDISDIQRIDQNVGKDVSHLYALSALQALIILASSYLEELSAQAKEAAVAELLNAKRSKGLDTYPDLFVHYMLNILSDESKLNELKTITLFPLHACAQCIHETGDGEKSSLVFEDKEMSRQEKYGVPRFAVQIDKKFLQSFAGIIRDCHRDV